MQRERIEQSCELNTPAIRIRAWERLHRLTLPRGSAHSVLSVVAEATHLTLEQVREEQQRRSEPASLPRLIDSPGDYEKEFVYESPSGEDFGEGRQGLRGASVGAAKVGYLLDQIRANGEKKELVAEVVTLAKHYGITTPYTSYLIVPDGAVPVVNFRAPGDKLRPVPSGAGGPVPGVLKSADPGKPPTFVTDFARKVQEKPGELGKARGTYADTHLKGTGGGKGDVAEAQKEAKDKKAAYDEARRYLKLRDRAAVQSGKLGVDLSVQMAGLRNQSRLEKTALRQVQGRQLMEIGGVWIDEGFTPKMKALVVKAQSDASSSYWSKPDLKDVFRLGNYLVWVTPSGTALVVDLAGGKEKLSDKEIDTLFVKK